MPSTSRGRRDQGVATPDMVVLAMSRGRRKGLALQQKVRLLSKRSIDRERLLHQDRANGTLAVRDQDQRTKCSHAHAGTLRACQRHLRGRSSIAAICNVRQLRTMWQPLAGVLDENEKPWGRAGRAGRTQTRNETVNRRPARPAMPSRCNDETLGMEPAEGPVPAQPAPQQPTMQAMVPTDRGANPSLTDTPVP